MNSRGETVAEQLPRVRIREKILRRNRRTFLQGRRGVDGNRQMHTAALREERRCPQKKSDRDGAKPHV
jgi:hypothetical protein